jgi:3-deoxy-D-manno-octulosonic-acid transferase
MSNQKVYAGSLALTKLKSAIITTKKGAKCLLIPIDANYFSEKDGVVYLNCSVIVRDEQDQYGQNGFISQKLDAEKYKELGAEKAKEIKLPILGNIKNFVGQNNDNEGATTIESPINPEEDDDLPF